MGYGPSLRQGWVPCVNKPPLPMQRLTVHFENLQNRQLRTTTAALLSIGHIGPFTASWMRTTWGTAGRTARACS
jgi:hypothetical protein